MDITSLVFLTFVAISLIIYWVTPRGYQWIVLLVDSLIFYFSNSISYTFLYLLVSVMSVWVATIFFSTSQSDNRKKKYVLISVIILNVAMLAVLKYTNLAINTLRIFKITELNNVTWIASLGISFYTLQIVAYLLDAYWGVVAIERNPLKLLLFTSYFPAILSGPINRFEDLGPQLFADHRFDYADVTDGMKRIALGMFKKLAISNRMAVIVDMLWNNVEVYHGVWIWIAVFGYVIQLYTDFSGCMDIVIGVSACFGIRLTENFRAPLFSKNIQEFWQRWHITLGQWLRDFIMNPILKSAAMIKMADWSKKKFGKKKGKKIPVYIAMLPVWLLMGLWHGNSWKYILGEGLWFWLAIVAGQLLEPWFVKLKTVFKIRDGRLWKLWQIVRTNIIFAIGTLFFRAASFTDALYRLRCSVGVNMSVQLIKQTIMDAMGTLGPLNSFLLFLSVIGVCIYDGFLYKNNDLLHSLKHRCFVVRWAVYMCMVLSICAAYSSGNQVFAYAQF